MSELEYTTFDRSVPTPRDMLAAFLHFAHATIEGCLPVIRVEETYIVSQSRECVTNILFFDIEKIVHELLDNEIINVDPSGNIWCKSDRSYNRLSYVYTILTSALLGEQQITVASISSCTDTLDWWDAFTLPSYDGDVISIKVEID